MALKLKTSTVDGKLYAEVKDGNPVYVDDADGEELGFDLLQLRSKISELNAESKQHRLSAKEKAETLEKFGDAKPEEVATLRATLTELGGPEGLAKLKEAGKTDVEAIKKSISDAYEGKLSEAGKTIETLTARERQLLVGNAFATSPFLSGTIFKDTRDVAESYFGKHFRVEDGKPVAYVGDNMVFSKEKPGEPASVNEALAYLISQHPQKDSFILATGGGSGAQQSQGGGGNNKSYENLSPVERITAARAAGQKT